MKLIEINELILSFAEYNKLKQKHRDVLRRRSESMLFYNT